MPYIVCAEENDRKWVAHVPDLPGCYAADTNREKAIQSIPDAIQEYVLWCESHGIRISGLTGPMMVAEVIRAWDFEDGVEVNAFFASDRPPILSEELKEYELLLSATRKDLVSVIQGVSPEEMNREFEDERWSILGVLAHVARAELWYLDRLGLALPKAELPAGPLDALTTVREHLLAKLPALVKQTGVVTIGGETWSARKVLRRALWHERDHVEHINKLKARLPRW